MQTANRSQKTLKNRITKTKKQYIAIAFKGEKFSERWIIDFKRHICLGNDGTCSPKKWKSKKT